MNNVLVFDVNETLLELSALDSIFARVFGAASVRPAWFMLVLQNSLVATITGRYNDFGALAGAALDMTAQKHGVAMNPEDRQEILGAVRNLPAHPDVIGGLEKLKRAGFRMVTLTNSPPQVVRDQLKNANLSGYFEKSYSVDSIKMFKPAAEVYQMAARELAVENEQVRLIAAHDWDVAGALLAGCRAAFIARPGKVLNPLMPAPDIIGRDLVDVAEKIITTDS